METEENFNKITSAINEKHESVVHEVCTMPGVMNLEDFYRIYEMDEKEKDEEYNNLPKVAPTIELFAEAFKKFEDFPSNLQKPKKAPPTRERLNSTISRSSPTLNDSTGSSSGNHKDKETSLSLLNLHKLPDVPTASETLSSFVKFQKQLKKLNSEILQKDMDQEYANKLKQLNVFAQQLEKLLPTEKVGKSALTPQEEDILEDLVKRMDDLNFIRSHQDVFRQQNGLISNNTPKLDNLVDVLSYCLLAVNSFNIN